MTKFMHKRWALMYLLPALLWGSGASLAQAQQPDKIRYRHASFWSQADVTQMISPYWGLGLDMVYRRRDLATDDNVLAFRHRESIRPWIHYQPSPQHRFSLSPAAYFVTHEFIGKPEDNLRSPKQEWRISAQWFRQEMALRKRLAFTQRYRYEMRWIAPLDSDRFTYLNRFRIQYRVRYAVLGEDLQDNGSVYLSASNEVFFHFGKNAGLNTFSQNRMLTGVGIRVCQSARLELMYVNRLRFRANGWESDQDHGPFVGLLVDQASGLQCRKKRGAATY